MMEWRREWKVLVGLSAGFLLCFFLPVGWGRFDGAVMEALHLVRWYAREHVVLCVLPAFFIAGAIAVFVRREAVMRYLGADANPVAAYGVASVSGGILAVCSCTVLPLFAGIYRMGAGLGPASAFLYSGPAINVLAVILTARVLGPRLGLARAVGAVVFSIVIGVCMHLIFRGEERERAGAAIHVDDAAERPVWQTVAYFAAMVGVLVFANWSGGDMGGLWGMVYRAKWMLTIAGAVALAAMLIMWFRLSWWKMAGVAAGVAVAAVLAPSVPMIPFAAGVVGLAVAVATTPGEAGEWFDQAWGLAKQILPLLFLGVLAAGFLLGRPEAEAREGLIPSDWIAGLVGGNSVRANLFASVAGAFMYFATLTEVPILEGLLSRGMGQGPALALLLAGPALSLPNMLVIRSVIGTKKTVVYVMLVIVMAAATGILFGAVVGEGA